MGTAITNSPRTLVADAARGAAAAASDLVWTPSPGYFTRREPLRDGQVALLSGGGSGHEPLHAGFVGAGMLAGACPGLVFTSPNAIAIRAATAAVHAGGGVLHIVKNYTGDVVNFKIAATFAAEDAIDVQTVVVADDVATESHDGPGRRGTAATIAVEKICGAAAERGDSLAEVAAWGRRVADGARSMAVATRPCWVPGAEKPSFDLPEGAVELGVGIHGERGTGRVPAMTATDTAAALCDPILESLGADTADVIVIVNGLGGTHPLELNVMLGEVADHLSSKGIRIRRAVVGSFVTAFDMAGLSVTLVRCDDDMLELWDAPTAAPGWPNAPAADFRPPAPRGETAHDTETDDGASDPTVTAWLRAFVERVLGSVDELTDLDRRAGDGDFGTNMRAALDGVEITDSDSVATLFRRLSDGYLGSAGGTSGAMFGVWFHSFDSASANAGELTSAALADAAASAQQTITDLGGATPGDKTMIDAIAPAAEALETARAHSVSDSLRSAADAAQVGADSTGDLVARRGRASYVGDAARGVIDPGALVIAWFFEEGARAYA